MKHPRRFSYRICHVNLPLPVLYNTFLSLKHNPIRPQHLLTRDLCRIFCGKRFLRIHVFYICRIGKEIAAIITHVAFYVGWLKGWAVFNLAKEVWQMNEGDLPYKDEAMRAHAKSMIFPIGAPNDAFAKYFVGQSYLAPVSTKQVGVFNVTFEPGCRNNWHIHHAKSGGGQILVCVAGRGYYQEEGKEAIEMKPGDCINIPAEVKHWHGAAPDSWFSHLAIEVPGEENSNEWCETVSDEEYGKLK